MRRRLVRHATALMLLAVLLVLAAAMALLRPIEMGPLAPVNGIVQLPPGPPEPMPIASLTNHLRQITDRPLFAKSRRNVQILTVKPPISVQPPAAVPQISPSPPPPISVDNLVLKGIYFHPVAPRVLIASPSNPTGVWMRTGARIEGWEIRRIAFQFVSLVQGETAAELKLYPATPIRFETTLR
jgi:hypothetical protein